MPWKSSDAACPTLRSCERIGRSAPAVAPLKLRDEGEDDLGVVDTVERLAEEFSRFLRLFATVEWTDVDALPRHHIPATACHDDSIAARVRLGWLAMPVN